MIRGTTAASRPPSSRRSPIRSRAWAAPISRVASSHGIACAILLLGTCAFLVSVGVLGAISTGIAVGVLANAIMLYFFFVENRVPGLLYLSHDRALGWFSAGKR